MSVPRISYIVITRNRERQLTCCLQSIYGQDYPCKEVIVVDNGTPGGSRSVLHHFPDVRLLELGDNFGIPEARNRGVLAATGEICIFIDDDAEFMAGDASQRVRCYFANDPRLAVIAFRIRDPSGREERVGIPRSDKRSLSEDYPCGYFCGCGFALRRQVFCELGMFWSDLFYGGEELDFSYRLVNKGYRLLHSHSVEVMHRRATAGRPEGQYLYFNARNRLWIAARNLPWPCALSTASIWWAYLLVLGVRRKQVRFLLRGIRDSLKGLPSVLGVRACIRRGAIDTLRACSGRLWY